MISILVVLCSLGLLQIAFSLANSSRIGQVQVIHAQIHAEILRKRQRIADGFIQCLIHIAHLIKHDLFSLLDLFLQKTDILVFLSLILFNLSLQLVVSLHYHLHELLVLKMLLIHLVLEKPSQV